VDKIKLVYIKTKHGSVKNLCAI